MNELEIGEERFPRHAIVTLRGELDVSGEAATNAAVDRAAESGHVVIDLRGLDFIDSSGLKLALVWQRRLRDRGVVLSLVRGPEHVQRPFVSAGLEPLLPFVEAPPG